MNNPHYYYKQVTSQQGTAIRDLLYLLAKLGVNKKGRIIAGMSMHKTTACDPGMYKISFTVKM